MSMRVAEIQRFCTHDGPGVRTTVFFKGCPLRCAWCHNPETQRFTPEIMLEVALCAGCGACVKICPAGAQIMTRSDRRRDISLCQSCGACTEVCLTEACHTVGREMTPEEIAGTVAKDAVFYGKTGGVTLSGGEPLCADGVVELLQLLKGQGLHVVVETSGACDPEILRAAVPYVDEFYWDIKHTDPELHKQYVGADNAHILANLALADSLGAVTRLRCLLVSGVNTDDGHWERVAQLYHSLSHCTDVELLQYHPMGGSKAAALGLADSGRMDWIPTKEQVAQATQILENKRVPVFLS